METDTAIRVAAFAWLDEQVKREGEVLRWGLLLNGFEFHGQRVPLLSQQGIFKPKVCNLPLSIRTSWRDPYRDSVGDGFLLYRYRGKPPEPFHRDNIGLRDAMRFSAPLIYFHGHVEGRYHVVWPVFIVGDDRGTGTFTVAVHEARQLKPGRWETEALALAEKPERKYKTIETTVRLHQRKFSERVISAYGVRCAMCRLRHRELLDGAHIVRDRDPLGEPIVSNGMALCKLHHAAYDGNFLTVTPEYRIEVRTEVLKEKDGPMLKHGLQGLHGLKIHHPKREDLKPSPELLARKMDEYLASIRGGTA